MRPPEQIESNIQELLDYYRGRLYVVKGDPQRGTQDREAALVNERTMDVWRQLQRHVRCIQDPKDTDVYILKAGCAGKVHGLC